MRKLLLLLLVGFGLQPALAGDAIPSAVTKKLTLLAPGAAPSYPPLW